MNIHVSVEAPVLYQIAVTGPSPISVLAEETVTALRVQVDDVFVSVDPEEPARVAVDAGEVPGFVISEETEVLAVTSTEIGPRGFTGPAGPPGPGSSVYRATLTDEQVLAQELTLPSAPLDPTLVKVTFLSGSVQDYGVDYTVSGNRLIWAGYGMETLTEAGEKLVIEY